MARRRAPYTPALPIDRQTAREIETFNKRVSVGLAVVHATADGKKKKKETAVKAVAEQVGRKDRYVWGTVALGAEIHANLLAILEKKAASKTRRSPRIIATVF